MKLSLGRGCRGGAWVQLRHAAALCPATHAATCVRLHKPIFDRRGDVILHGLFRDAELLPDLAVGQAVRR